MAVLVLLALWRLQSWREQLPQRQMFCAQYEGKTLWMQALAVRSGEDRYTLSSLQGETSQGRVQWEGKAVGYGRLATPKRVFGLRFLATVHCSFPRRNPSVAEDFLYPFQDPKLSLTFRNAEGKVLEAWPSSLRAMGKLAGHLSPFPLLQGFALALWTGEERFVPRGLLELYRDAGLLPVLALSGQHVVALGLVLGAVARGLFFVVTAVPQGRWFRVGVGIAARAGLLVPALCLAWTSRGHPTLLRALAFLGVGLLLQGRGFRTSLLQRALTSLALLLVWDPSLIGEVSFGLSAFAAAILSQVVASGRSLAIGRYLAVSFAVTVCALPLSAFYFGKIALLAPFLAVTVGALWDFLLIPFLFGVTSLSFFELLPYAHLQWVECALAHFLQVQCDAAAQVAQWSWYCVRPTLGEVLFCLVFFCSLTDALFRGGLVRLRNEVLIANHRKER